MRGGGIPSRWRDLQTRVREVPTERASFHSGTEVCLRGRQLERRSAAGGLPAQIDPLLRGQSQAQGSQVVALLVRSAGANADVLVNNLWNGDSTSLVV